MKQKMQNGTKKNTKNDIEYSLQKMQSGQAKSEGHKCRKLEAVLLWEVAKEQKTPVRRERPPLCSVSLFAFNHINTTWYCAKENLKLPDIGRFVEKRVRANKFNSVSLLSATFQVTHRIQIVNTALTRSDWRVKTYSKRSRWNLSWR